MIVSRGSTNKIRPLTEPEVVSSVTTVPRKLSNTVARSPCPGAKVAKAALAQLCGSSGIDTDTALPDDLSITVNDFKMSLIWSLRHLMRRRSPSTLPALSK